MKRMLVYGVGGVLFLLSLGAVAQDTLTVFEVADTSLAVAEELVNSLPGVNSGWQDFALWGVSLLALVVGLINFFKGKKVVLK